MPGLLAVILLFSGAAFLAARLDPLPPRFSGIAHAADGDSFRVGGDRVRLIGIDAPERDQICWKADGSEWACGHAAFDRLRELLAAGPADCQPEGVDKYGRTLAACEVSDVNLGSALVSEGLAIAYGAYEQEENGARTARLGIWQGRFVDPRRWREEGPVEAPQPGFFELLWNWFRELTGATTLR